MRVSRRDETFKNVDVQPPIYKPIHDTLPFVKSSGEGWSIAGDCCEISRTRGAIASRGITTRCTVTLTRLVSGVYWSTRAFRDSSIGELRDSENGYPLKRDAEASRKLEAPDHDELFLPSSRASR